MSSTPTEPESQFQVFINLTGLKHPLRYWEENLPKIRAEITNQHGIIAAYTITEFVTSDPIILVPTRIPSSDEPAEKNKYAEAQSKIAAMVAKYDA